MIVFCGRQTNCSRSECSIESQTKARICSCQWPTIFNIAYRLLLPTHSASRYHQRGIVHGYCSAGAGRHRAHLSSDRQSAAQSHVAQRGRGKHYPAAARQSGSH